MTYAPPPPEAEGKPRYVRVTDPVEIEAIRDKTFRAPNGKCEDGIWYAEVNSLRQFRGQKPEIIV